VSNFRALELPSGDFTVATPDGKTAGRFATRADAERHAAMNGMEIRHELTALRVMVERLLRIVDGSKGELRISAAARHAGKPVSTFRRNYIETGKIALTENGKVRRVDVEGLA
jgi:hypothetical protein